MKSLLKEVYELNHFLFSLCPCVLIKLSSVLLVLLVIMYQLLCWKYYYKGKTSRQLWEFFVLAMI